MSTISTHVLDTALGKPAAGIAVRLERPEDGGGWFEVTPVDGNNRAWTERVEGVAARWVEISRGKTDADGRCRDLAANLPAGVYRLVFDTGSYLRGDGRSSIYPEISVTFNCSGEGHYHLPLLLSDNGFTTYRGT